MANSVNFNKQELINKHDVEILELNRKLEETFFEYCVKRDEFDKSGGTPKDEQVIGELNERINRVSKELSNAISNLELVYNN